MIKIPRAYPKIPDTKDCPLKQCIAFSKEDGTNIHILWDKDHWAAFGTRRSRFAFDSVGIREFNKKYPDLIDVPVVFNRVYSSIGEKYKDRKLELYFEFLGDNSFAGLHKLEDAKRLVMIDAMVDEIMLPPQEFLDTFSEVIHPEYYIAKVIYRGKYSGRLADDVRKGKYDVFEGVVVKGVVKGEIYRAKIKTDKYMEKLKSQFKDGWKNYWE